MQAILRLVFVGCFIVLLISQMVGRLIPQRARRE